MATYLFRFDFQHTTETIKKLSSVQYLSFRKLYIAIQVVIGAASVYFGAMSSDPVTQVLFMFFGCWLIISWKQIPDFRASKIINQANGELPKCAFAFSSEGFSVKTGNRERNREYPEIIRIVSDGTYCYLFIDKERGYMVPSSEEFKTFICEKTSLQIIPVKSIFFVSFRQILKERKNTKN
jgi:hypothetical protein